MKQLKFNNIVIHPFLFSIYPILFLFSSNIDEVAIEEVYFSTLFFLSFTLLLWLALIKFIKDKHKTGIILSILLISFFSIGHIYALIKGESTILSEVKNNDSYVSYYMFLLSWFIAILVMISLIKRVKAISTMITINLNVISIILAFIPLLNIMKYTYINYLTKENVWSNKLNYLQKPKNIRTPDIYYIIPDRYANNNTMKKHYDFDNSKFLTFLEKKGFYIANNSKSNYLRTIDSLASSLNCSYINDLVGTVNRKSTDITTILKLGRKSYVPHHLKSIGYKYILIGAKYWKSDEYVDRHFFIGTKHSFAFLLTRTSALYPLAIKLFGYSTNFAHWKKTMYWLDNLEKITEKRLFKEPMFVFTHVLIPHEPFVFNRDGKFIEKSNLVRKEAYVEQVMYINKRLYKIIDNLLSKPEPERPIIILQSDEGPYPKRSWGMMYEFHWDTATKEELEEKMGILNAYYLPEVDPKRVLYPSISPVNSFRVVFDTYFNTMLGLLPDRFFGIEDFQHPYSFFDITNKVVID